MENIFSKLKLNPKTNRYDYDGDLGRNELNTFFVSEDKDGFIINFGKITGDFICINLGLKSLKGAPRKVGRTFSCNYNPNLHSLDGIGEVKGEIYKGF